MKLKKFKTTKKCPRCGNKCLINQSKCEECGLLFSRLEFASNKAAKKKLLKFDRDYIIYTNQYPKDLSWWKLLFITAFFGLFGGHYYYVGKYIKGGLMSASFIYLIFCTIFNVQMVELLENYYFYVPIGIAGFAWIYSLVTVCFKRFKVPVIVDLPETVDLRAEVAEKTANKSDEKTVVLSDETKENKATNANKKSSNSGNQKLKKDIKKESGSSATEETK